jgi:hypothetical protein
MNSEMPSLFLLWSSKVIRTFFNFKFFFQSHSPTLNLLGIELYNLFWFSFYEVIHVSQLESQVLWVSCVDSGHFFVLCNWFFSQFHPSTLVWLRIGLYNCFFYTFYEFIMISWLHSRVLQVKHIDSIFLLYL